MSGPHGEPAAGLRVLERTWDARGGQEPGSARVIEDAIADYNVASTGRDDWFGLVLELRDGQGRLRGGLRGTAWAGWLHVNYLWIDEPLRRAGHGSGLLAEAERLAAARGCRDVHLDSFDWQGVEFYPRFGYREFGRLEGHPEGHVRVYFHKRLASGPQTGTRRGGSP